MGCVSERGGGGVGSEWDGVEEEEGEGEGEDAGERGRLTGNEEA